MLAVIVACVVCLSHHLALVNDDVDRWQAVTLVNIFALLVQIYRDESLYIRSLDYTSGLADGHLWLFGIPADRRSYSVVGHLIGRILDNFLK